MRFIGAKSENRGYLAEKTGHTRQMEGEDMERRKRISVWCFLMGGILAAATVGLALGNRDAEPLLVKQPKGAVQAAEAVMDAICAGDYETAGTQMYGCPKLTSGEETDSEIGRMLWAAFAESLAYELDGQCRPCPEGVQMRVQLQSLDLNSVTGNLRQRAKNLLVQRVEEASQMEEVYDETNSYREAFVMAVLQEAAEQALEADGRIVRRELELTLTADGGQWRVVPSQNLMNAISGGTIG